MLKFSEVLMYPPYWRNGLLAIPFNRSVVLGPHEIKGVNLQGSFLEGEIHQILGALPNRKVVFLWKTNGKNIWRALKNYSKEPQHILPWHDLILVKTRVGFFQVPNKPIMQIPKGQKGREFLRKIKEIIVE